MTRLALTTLMVLSCAVSPAAAVDGRTLYNNACRTCHSLKEGDNRLGPSLHGVVGRKAGSLERFPFSEPMRTSGLTWDEQTLDRFIENPDGLVNGNGMKPYGGITDKAVRAAIIAYLKGGS
jgi:cytochrome c